MLPLHSIHSTRVIVTQTAAFSCMKAVHKVNIFHTKIFFNSNTKTEYTSFGTYLFLLFHIVTFDIKVLVVPWHWFVYTLFIPRGYLVIQPASFKSSSVVKRLPARCSFSFGNRKKSDGARSGLYRGCSKISYWNCSCRKACVCWAVCGRTLSCNRTIPRESLPLRQDNLKSNRPAENEYTLHLTVSGILNWHSYGHSYLCTYHVTSSDVQLHEPIFDITLNTRNQ